MHKNSSPSKLSLDFHPQNATAIDGCIAKSSSAGIISYFANLEPIFLHANDDLNSRRVIIGRLQVVNKIPQKRLAESFGVHRNTVSSSAAQFRANGFNSFSEKNWSKPNGIDLEGYLTEKSMVSRGKKSTSCRQGSGNQSGDLSSGLSSGAA